MRTNLKEKVALVTGASSGLGERFARVLAANGALVVLAARRVERLKELRAQIESAGGEAHVVALDVTDQDAIAAAVAEVAGQVGPIDILVNNSGVSTQQRLPPGQPDFVDAQIRKIAGERRHFLERQDVLARKPNILLLRHAVGAPQVAAVGHRQAQTFQRPPERVDQRSWCHVLGIHTN